jgi:hypothetical protein
MVKEVNIMQKIIKQYTDDQQSIITYLKAQISEGKKYFKSKHIGIDLNMSPRTVGTNLIKISKKHKTLKISAYADNGTATTWRIEYNRYAKG